MDNDIVKLVLLGLLVVVDAFCLFLALVNWREIDCHLKWKKTDYHLGKSWLFSRDPVYYMVIAVILSFFVSMYGEPVRLSEEKNRQHQNR